MAKKVSAKSKAKSTAKKSVKKTASSKATKKAASSKATKKAAQEVPVLQEQTTEVSSIAVSAAEITAAPAETAPTEAAHAETPAEASSEPADSTSSIHVEESHIQITPVQAQTEEKDMAESKGVGKEYNPSEFSQPATEVGSSSKVYLYVGISVVALAVIVGALFFLGGFSGKGSDSGLTGSTVTAYCSDTDGGYNRFTKGVAQGIYYLNYSSGEFMDHCEDTDANKLTEYYCKNDLIVYTTEPCPDGLKCADGICA